MRMMMMMMMIVQGSLEAVWDHPTSRSCGLP
jgi:hypothetical protein